MWDIRVLEVVEDFKKMQKFLKNDVQDMIIPL